MADILDLLLLILLKQLTGLYCTIPDPCPDIQPSTKVADMCSNNYAIEESEDGSYESDNVVIRVMNQTGGCICHVTAEYQNGPTVLYIRKYKNLNSAAPVEGNCGLNVNITYQETQDISTTYSMTCTDRQALNSVPLIKNGITSLIPNVTDGNFTRGYCIEIIREPSSEPNLALRVVCGNPGILPSTLLPQPTTTITTVKPATTITTVKPTTTITTVKHTTTITTTNPTKTTTTTITSSTVNPKHDSSTVQSDTTDDKTHHTVSQTETSQQTTKVTQAAQNTDQEKSSILYVTIGASAGFIVIFVLIIITTVLYRRKRSGTKTQEGQNDNEITDQTADQDYDGLKYNVLYISSEKQDNLEVDYSTVDSDSPAKGQDDTYAVVDKSKKHRSAGGDKRTNREGINSAFQNE